MANLPVIFNPANLEVLTDSNGLASTASLSPPYTYPNPYLFPNNPGEPGEVLADVPGYPKLTVKFEVFANTCSDCGTPGLPIAILKLFGDGQVGTVGSSLQPFVVQVTDAFGNPVPNVTVNFSLIGEIFQGEGQMIS